MFVFISFKIVFMFLHFFLIYGDKVIENQNYGSINTEEKPYTPISDSIVVEWYNTEFRAQDVAVGADGSIYAISKEKKALFKYNLNQDSFEEVVTDHDLKNIKSVAVNPFGVPYVCTYSGETYYLDFSENNWVMLPGCCKDIAIGLGGEIWKIGCDLQTENFYSDDQNLKNYFYVDPRKYKKNYGVWKLFCFKSNSKFVNSNDAYDTQVFNKFFANKKFTNRNKKNSKCFWNRINGKGRKIGVKNDGFPIVIVKSGSVYEYKIDKWSLLGGVEASDITISNENSIFVSGLHNSIYKLKLNRGKDSRWIEIKSKCTKAISSGPYDQLTKVSCEEYNSELKTLSYNYIY